MPIYTYECEECGVRFDARQKFTDNALTECPECTGHVHRIPQAVGIVFKGSGWYVTDSKGRNNLAVPPKKEGGDDATKPAETKPASSDAAPNTTTSADTKKDSSIT